MNQPDQTITTEPVQKPEQQIADQPGEVPQALATDWIETRREYKINEKGEQVLTGITTERRKVKIAGFEKKDFIDFSLRTLALLAIFVPILLFYLQQKNEIRKKKADASREIYSNIAADVYTIIDVNSTVEERTKAKQRFYFDSYPRLKFLGDKEYSIKATELKNAIQVYLNLIDFINDLDSIYTTSRNLYAVVLTNRNSFTGPSASPVQNKVIKYNAIRKIIQTTYDKSSDKYLRNFVINKNLTDIGDNPLIITTLQRQDSILANIQKYLHATEPLTDLEDINYEDGSSAKYALMLSKIENIFPTIDDLVSEAMNAAGDMIKQKHQLQDLALAILEQVQSSIEKTGFGQ
jgi:hypothetical protein